MSRTELLQQLVVGTILSTSEAFHQRKHSILQSEPTAAAKTDKRHSAPNAVGNAAKVPSASKKSAAKTSTHAEPPVFHDVSTFHRVAEQTMTVPELKQEYQDRGLPTAGCSNKPKQWYIDQLGNGSLRESLCNDQSSLEGLPRVSETCKVRELTTELRARRGPWATVPRTKADLLQLLVVGTVLFTSEEFYERKDSITQSDPSAAKQDTAPKKRKRPSSAGGGAKEKTKTKQSAPRPSFFGRDGPFPSGGWYHNGPQGPSYGGATGRGCVPPFPSNIPPPVDHYKVLGIPRTALSSEIRKAYMKLALKYHPDKNSDEGAVEMFRAVQTAYNILRQA